jgi:hypothetical protein
MQNGEGKSPLFAHRGGTLTVNPWGCVALCDPLAGQDSPLWVWNALDFA